MRCVNRPAAAARQSRRCAYAPGRPPTVSDQRIADIVVEWDEVVIVLLDIHCFSDFVGEFRGHAFVGIHFQDPVAVTRIQARIAPVALDIPAAFNNPIGEEGGNGVAVVGALIEYNDQFVGETQPFQTLGELFTLVVGNHEGR